MNYYLLTSIVKFTRHIYRWVVWRFKGNFAFYRFIRKYGLPLKTYKTTRELYFTTAIKLEDELGREIISILLGEECIKLFDEGIGPYKENKALELADAGFRESTRRKLTHDYGTILYESMKFVQVFSNIDSSNRTPTEKEILGFLTEIFEELTPKPPIFEELNPNIKRPQGIINQLFYLESKSNENKRDDRFPRDPIEYNSLNEIIRNSNDLFVLLGDGGSGKSTSFKDLAFELRGTQPIFVIYRELKNLYNNDYSSWFPDSLQNIPKNKLLILLDGLDEIPQGTMQKVVDNITLFKENNTYFKIIVGCRKLSFLRNRFPDHIEIIQIKDFDLHSTEVRKFLNQRKTLDVDRFIEALEENELTELINTPFSLIHIINFFERNGRLPTSKLEAMVNYIEEDLKKSKKKYAARNFPTILNPDENLISSLEVIAFAMQLVGTTIISKSDLNLFFKNNNGVLKLMLHSGLLSKTGVDAHEEQWSFVHKLYQEYFAAHFMVNFSSDQIMELVTYENRFLLPGWINTISFLIGISSQKEILYDPPLELSFLELNDPLLFKMEAVYLPDDFKFRFFKKIYEQYRTSPNGFISNRFDETDIAKFCNASKTIDYLIKDLEASEDDIVVLNLLRLLPEFSFNNDQLLFLRKILEDFLNQSKLHPDILCQSIRVLYKLELFDYTTTRMIVEKVTPSKDQYIRSATYLYIALSGHSDKFLPFLFDGYNLLSTRKEKLINEGHNLNYCFKKIKTTKGIDLFWRSLLRENKDDTNNNFLEPVSHLVITAIDLYKGGDADIFGIMLNWLIEECLVLNVGRLIQLRRFFIETKSTRLAIKSLVLNYEEKKSFPRRLALAMVIDLPAFGLINDFYTSGNFTKEYILSIQDDMYRLNTDWQTFQEFCEKNMSITQPENTNSTNINFDKRGLAVRERDLLVLSSISTYKAEIMKPFSLLKKDTISRNELYKLSFLIGKDFKPENILTDSALAFFTQLIGQDRSQPNFIKDTIATHLEDTAKLEFLMVKHLLDYHRSEDVSINKKNQEFLINWAARPNIQNLALNKLKRIPKGFFLQNDRFLYYFFEIVISFDIILIPEITNLGIHLCSSPGFPQENLYAYLMNQLGYQEFESLLIKDIASKFNNSLNPKITYLLSNYKFKHKSLIINLLNRLSNDNNKLQLLNTYIKLLPDHIFEGDLLKQSAGNVKVRLLYSLKNKGSIREYQALIMSEYKDPKNNEIKNDFLILLLYCGNVESLKKGYIELQKSRDQDFEYNFIQALVHFNNPKGIDTLMKLMQDSLDNDLKGQFPSRSLAMDFMSSLETILNIHAKYFEATRSKIYSFIANNRELYLEDISNIEFYWERIEIDFLKRFSKVNSYTEAKKMINNMSKI